MFSAFSFGKIIKTILPGLILAMAVVLLLEVALRQAFAVSLLARLADKDFAAAAAGVLVPLSLILGFFLNTLVWLGCNRRMRRLSDEDLSGTVFPELKTKLYERSWQAISEQLGDPGLLQRRPKDAVREPLEYFYLPLLSVEHLNYLWESYFSWYEFQMNSAVALLFLLPGEALLPWMAFYPGRPKTFFACLALVPLTFFLAAFLCHAARKNLTEYRKNLLLLISGALVFSAKPAAAETKEKAWWSWFTP